MVDSVKDNSKAGVVLRKFGSIFGAQKMVAMWHGTDMAEVKSDWNRQLEKFSGQTIGIALQSVVDSGKEWPPTLAEFVRICRDYQRAESQPVHKALPAMGQGHTDNDTARANLVRIRQMMSDLANKKRVGAANSLSASGHQAGGLC